jgi:hypothetical protein
MRKASAGSLETRFVALETSVREVVARAEAVMAQLEERERRIASIVSQIENLLTRRPE